VMLKSIVVLLLLIAVVLAKKGDKNKDNVHPTPLKVQWVNRTVERFFKDDELGRYYFAVSLERPASAYYLQLAVEFETVSEQFTISFDEVPSTPENPNVISKEKTLRSVVVLQTEEGPAPGWSTNGLDCALLSGYLQSDVVPKSLAFALRFTGHPHQPDVKRCLSLPVARASVFAALLLLTLLAALAFVCCCCVCLCIRRCVRRRARCAKRCARNAAAAAACCQDTPPEAVTAGGEQYLVPAGAVEEGAAYFVPIPVEAAPQNTAGGAQYVALVPMYPGNVQQA